MNWSVRILLYKLDTETGQIIIDKAVIRRIVAECLGVFEGKVRLANYKGQSRGMVSKISGIDDSGLITVAKSQTGIEIRINITIRFGTSINRVTDQLIADIKENVFKLAGVEVSGVTILIVGIMSKKLVRRNIEVKG